MRAKKRTSAASVREGAGRSVGGVGTYSGETTYGLPFYGWYLHPEYPVSRRLFVFLFCVKRIDLL